LIDIENASKIQMEIKNWILGFFPKFQIGVETRVHELHFVSWTQIQKISFLWRNFRFRAKSSNFPKYTENSIFCDPFFSNFSFTWRQTLARLQTQLGTLHNPPWKVNKKKKDEKSLSIASKLILCSSQSHDMASPAFKG